MATTTRPSSHAQREQLIRTLSSYFASGSADATVTELHARFLADAATAYTAARVAWFSAHGAWQAASNSADDADEEFDASLRRLMLGFRDDQGRLDPALNQALLGGVQMSELIAMRYAEEVTRARGFLGRLAARTDLSPNPERLAAFTAATDALEAAATAEALALGDRLAAGSASEAASASFDTAWGKFVRALRAMVDPALAESLVVRFTIGGGAGEAESS